MHGLRRHLEYSTVADTVIETPHMVDRRKQEGLGAPDAAVTPLSQMRGSMYHERWNRRPPP